MKKSALHGVSSGPAGSSSGGEVLYNGIRLPAEWPPQSAIPKDQPAGEKP